MRVLMVNHSDFTKPGGVHMIIRKISENLSQRGHSITILNVHPKNKAIQNDIVLPNVEVLRIYSSWGNKLYGYTPELPDQFKKYINQIKPDIIDIHGYHTLFSYQIITLIKKTNPNIPVIFSPHLDVERSSIGGKLFWGLYNRTLGKSLVALADHIVVSSRFELNLLSILFEIHKSCSIIPLGVDIIAINKPQKKSAYKKLLYAGHLVNRKKVENVIFATDYLINKLKNNNFSLTIIGEGPTKKKLINIVRSLNLDEFVFFEPFLPREQLIEKVRDSDIFILLSESEAFGIAIAEALALGTPCIVSDITALKEFTNEPGCFGVSYPPDPKDVAELIIKITKSPNVGPLSGRIRLWNAVADEYESLYLSMCEN